MSVIEGFDIFWNNIDGRNAYRIRKNFDNLVPGLLEGLIRKLMSQDSFEIGIGHQGRKRWAIITYDQWESEKELTLQYGKKTGFEL